MNSAHLHISLMKIIKHLQEESFIPFIDWNSQVCSINDLEIFSSIVLPTLFKGISTEEFLKVLDSYEISYCLSKSELVIIFPCEKPKQVKRSRSGNPILKRFDEIEAKQAKLMESILRAREKLKLAIRINDKIKSELRKSDQYQKFLLEGNSVL